MEVFHPSGKETPDDQQYKSPGATSRLYFREKCFKSIQEALAILIVPKDRFAFHSTYHHVVENTKQAHSRQPGHG